MNPVCPYCRGDFEASDVVAMCPACATPHHKDCLQENGGCTVFGCIQAPGDEPKIRVMLEDLNEHLPAPLDQTTAATRITTPEPQWRTRMYLPESIHETVAETFQETVQEPVQGSVQESIWETMPQSVQTRPSAAPPQFGIVLERELPPPPRLPWPLLLLLSILTAGLFLLIWDLVLAKWLRDVQPRSRAIYYYSAVLILQLLAMAGLVGGRVDTADATSGPLLMITVIVLLLLGRFSMRRSLEDYFDQTMAMGLSLSEAMTFFFGCVYFQYHLNHSGNPIPERQQAIA